MAIGYGHSDTLIDWHTADEVEEATPVIVAGGGGDGNGGDGGVSWQ